MRTSDPVDSFVLPWRSFVEFFAGVRLDDRDHLTELASDGSRTTWSRAEWHDYVMAVATDLRNRGIETGDCVASLCGNRAEAIALAFGCWVVGACYVPLNVAESVDRILFIVGDADVRVLIHDPTYIDLVEQIRSQSAVVIDLPVARTSRVSDADCAELAARAPSLQTAALRVYTLGTTGTPKGVILTAQNLLTDCDAMYRVLEWAEETRILTVLPVHHVNGLVISNLLPWFAGYSTVLCDRFRSDRFWSDIESEQATVCSMVPTLLEFLLEAGTADVPEHFQEVLCGAGPLMPETVAAFEYTFKVPVRHLYGLSETTAVATLMGRMATDKRLAWYCDHGYPSIGAALPHVEVAVADASGGLLGPAERGELVIRGATVMREYAGRAAETAVAMQGGWFHSGDQGFWLPDDNGVPYYFVTGRIKELIIRGGVNLSPFQIDEVLSSHPSVRFGLAIGFENRYYGEEVAAYVVADRPVNEREILDYCSERLDFAHRPKVVVFGQEVPFTATGKAKRLALMESLSDELSRYRDHQFKRSEA